MKKSKGKSAPKHKKVVRNAAVRKVAPKKVAKQKMTAAAEPPKPVIGVAAAFMQDPVAAPANASSLAEVSNLARMALAKENEIDTAEQTLKVLKAQHRALVEEDLPGLMKELRLSEIKLDDGAQVKIADDVYCSLTEENKPAAFDWLTKEGFDGLIKTEVSVTFGRDGLKTAVALVERLRKLKLEPALGRNVHPQTLKAFLREQIEAATAVPLELFGARPVTVAKIKAPKAQAA